MNERWLEPLLERDLANATAPDELWSRVQFPRERTASGVPVRRVAWALAAAALVLAVLGLRASRQPAVLHSSSAVEIQAWVKTNTGLDPGLPVNPPRSIQLIGAHVIPGGVEVAYRAANHDARLLVSKADISLDGSAATFSWTRHGQRFTLACATPAELQAACVLCHT